LVVASILISVGTSFKLPLSTTYVTFMVAMGTSLADRAWDKESAVFRITGVISVIGGWFFTAFSAFTVAFLVALLFSYGGFYAIFAMMGIVVFIVIKSYAINKKRDKEKSVMLKEIAEDNVLEECKTNITDTLNNVSDIIDNIVVGLANDDRKLLKETNKDVAVLNKQAKYLKDNVYTTIKRFDKNSIKISHFYVQVLDYLRETAHDLTFISKSSLDHVDNNFGELLEVQIKELEFVAKEVREYYKQIIDTINTKKYENVQTIIDLRQNLIEKMNDYRTIQIKRVKHKEAGTKNSMLYLGILHEIKNLLLNGTNLLKAQRDFDDFKKV
jgi:Na+/phosphate symporter